LEADDDGCSSLLIAQIVSLDASNSRAVIHPAEDGRVCTRRESLENRGCNAVFFTRPFLFIEIFNSGFGFGPFS
jgi:hypothetical protein